MTVTEQGAGNKTELEGNQHPANSGINPVAGNQVSSNVVYSQEQLDERVEAAVKSAVHSVKSETGREIADLKKKVGDLTIEKDNLSEDLRENEQTVTNLQRQLEDMASNDPARFDVVKELRSAQSLTAQLKRDYRDKKNELSRRENELLPREEKVAAFEIDLLVEEIADDKVFEGANVKQLRDICRTAGIKTEEGVRKLAETLWVKKIDPNQTNPVHVSNTPKPFPGYTGGGSTGRVPTVEELRASHPEETQKKVESGEWRVPGWVKR